MMLQLWHKGFSQVVHTNGKTEKSLMWFKFFGLKKYSPKS